MEQSTRILDHELLFDHAPCGYMVCEASTKIISVNQTLASLLGKPKELLTEEFLIDLVPETTQAFLTNHYLPLLESLGAINEVFICFSKTGGGVECSLSGKLIQDPTTGLPHYFFTFVDLTGPTNIKKGFDSAIGRVNTRYEVLKKKLEEFEKFIFSPERGLHPRLAQLEKEIELLHKEALFRNEGEYLANKIKNLTTISNRMIHDFSTYNYLNTSPKMEIIQLRELILKVVCDLQPKLRIHQATVHVPELPLVLGNSKQLQLLFKHLIGNALKFRSSAVPIIKIIAEEPVEDMVKINVLDNGKGIEKEDVDRIFEFMYQVDDTGTVGAGLGIPICKKIVSNHHGTLGVETYYGNGSNFHFTLPLGE